MAYKNINKLQRTFVPGQILYARDVTESDSKTNEIIDALNSVGPSVESMDTAVTNLSQTVEGVSTNITNLDASVTEINKTVVIIDSSVKQFETNIDGKMNDDGSNYKGSKPLVTPTINSTWKIYGKGGTLIATKTDRNITVETGASVTWDATWKWDSSTGYKNPERCDGITTVLPDSGNPATIPTVSGITSSITYTENLYASASGLIVKNNVVVKATGEDKTSASTSVTFKGRQYYGGYDSIVTTKEQLSTAISSLENTTAYGTTRLNTTWVDTNNGIKIQYGETGEDLKYIYFIYPKSWGLIEKTTTDGANTYSDWEITDGLSITNEYGADIPCYVYRTTGKKTTGTNGIVFRFFKVN